MLQSLRLKNFAVIEELEISFGGGLTVLTGETGAGKSMLIDALELLTGGRAEPQVVRAGADEAVVEGVFEARPELNGRLEALGLPSLGSEVCVRRTVGAKGKSRVHVNGSLATVGVLERLMEGLVAVAGQHEHVALLEPGRHLGMLDRFGGEALAVAQAAHADAWGALREIDGRLTALTGPVGEIAGRRDFVAFLLDELEKVDPRPGEDEQLDTERRRLAGAERLRRGAATAEHALATGEGAAVDVVGRAIQQLAELETLDGALGPVNQALVTAQAELEDAARGLSRYLSHLEADPRRLAEVEDRLDVLRRLSRKHACPLSQVIAKREALAAELAALDGRAESEAALQQAKVGATAAAQRTAQALTAARTEAARALQARVRERLDELAMPKARFEVRLEAGPLGPTGADALCLEFSANPGEPLRPVAKVASGGEASRLMLAMRAALAGVDGAACVVFDEADAGLGGAQADVVGRLIREVAGRTQVLCITHLAQVAAHADAHLRIEKREAGGRTRSVVNFLPPGQPRAEELARMLSGLTVTREALSAAEALLRTARALPHVVGSRKRNVQTAPVRSDRAPRRARERSLAASGPRA